MTCYDHASKRYNSYLARATDLSHSYYSDDLRPFKPLQACHIILHLTLDLNTQ